MTGPDGSQSTNEARAQGSGTVYQAGQIHGGANMGNTRTTTISLPAFGVVLGVVMTLVVGFAVWKLVATDGQPTGTAAPTSSGTRTPPDGVRTKEVTLTRETGVDVDGNDTSAKDAEGPTGEIDLHLTRFNLLYPSGSGFAADSGHEDKAQERCTKAVVGGKNTGGPTIPSTIGQQLCFATSSGQIGWLRVKSSSLASYDASSSVVLAVRVWPRP
ncbi:hypothetical protein GCM10011609_55220 [Lentzea pudingi]|uniref:Serine/threonine protein kinase n=1 Tax=Lentzea pudingi TaxID=1789439 RepID=A0ABQ2IHT4_9PSEU|nr:hypothetical protein [Lentzea pudingi]GGN08540.1 hypothetical protein GCM10011609_55220 [Lentzea pudingi]